MAHGGDLEWNRSVLSSTEGLDDSLPTELVFGMADPLSLEAGLKALQRDGVRRVAVVRLFMSGESFAHQTNYLLGLSATPPLHFVLMGPAQGLGPVPDQIAHSVSIATHSEGMMRSPEAAAIVAERARDASTQPDRESVLIIAHGMAGENENARVLDAMQVAADEVAAAGFANVRIATLREDWAEERHAAEAEIRAYVEDQSRMKRKVLVVPFRLSGFGPYAEVLDGLVYTPTKGFFPHPGVSDWIRRTASRVICSQGWGDVLDNCANAALTVR